MEILKMNNWAIFFGTFIAILILGIWLIERFSDPDLKDEDDREIYEHNYWKKKKR